MSLIPVFGNRRLLITNENQGARSAYPAVHSKSTKASGLRSPGTLHFVVPKERRMGYILDSPLGHTLNHIACPACEKAKEDIMAETKELADLCLEPAAEVWLQKRSLYIRESTMECYRDYLKRLYSFFTFPLKQVHIGHFVEYQGFMKRKYCPASVNHDLNLLSQILDEAGLWKAIAPHYRPLPLPEADPIKVMSEAEEDKFFEFASSKQEWWLAYTVASLTNNSTASGKELRSLKLEAIHLDSDPPYFHVPKNMKTPQRQRSIPLNERGVTMMQRLIQVANSRGSTQPEHYLFPFRVKRNFFDPTRHASESWLKAQWKKLVDAALEAKVITFRIKPHNLRHQSITKMLEYGVPIETVRLIAGHGVDSVITRSYNHARMETLAKAVAKIDPGKKRGVGA